MSSKSTIQYHMVFVTKYRRPALMGIEEDVYGALRAAARGQRFTIVSMGVDLGNHVHLVLEASPTISPAQIARRLKQCSTFALWRMKKAHLRCFYWKKRRLLWADGYFVTTVGQVSQEKILSYVRSQAKGRV